MLDSICARCENLCGLRGLRGIRRRWEEGRVFSENLRRLSDVRILVVVVVAMRSSA